MNLNETTVNIPQKKWGVVETLGVLILLGACLIFGGGLFTAIGIVVFLFAVGGLIIFLSRICPWWGAGNV